MVTRYGVEAAHVRTCYAGIAWSSKPFLKFPVPAGYLRLETRYTGLLPANGHACSPALWRPSCTTYGDTAAPGSQHRAECRVLGLAVSARRASKRQPRD